ncbi:TonB-dependent receptor [Sphingobacterium sp. SGG-5]|nr:TonB-dependent receptor [Sphingobacterium sp. SGG-5]
MHASASTFGQKISITVKQASFQDVLVAIQKQTNYDFLYNNAHIKNLHNLDLSVKNKDLTEVLNTVLTPNGLVYALENNIVLIKPKEELDRSVVAVQQAVDGYVRDENGRPVAGATVALVNSNLAIATDDKGYFSLPVPVQSGSILITAVGFEAQQLNFQQGQTINVTLQMSLSDLDEVVIVGYGVQKKANLTGAVAQINADEIALRPDANIASTLQGLMPGLNIQINTGDPTATPDINVRGFNSINGGSPLVLIDGIEGNITRVNPNDIESVTVLKDAASAAIYGARGSFGVILITTKQGKAGDMKVDYTNNFGWTTPTTRTDYLSDPYVYGKTVDAAIYGYNGTSYTGYNEMDWQAIKMVANGEIEPFHELQPDGTYKFFYNTDWWDYQFKQYQPSNFHNIAVSGGSEKLKGYLSGRVYNRETINKIADDGDMDRYNIKTNLTFSPNKWLEISNNIQFINEYDKEYGGFRNGYGGLWSTTSWYNLFAFYPTHVNGIAADIGPGGTGGQGGQAAMEARTNWQTFNTEELTNTFRVKVTPLEGLEFNLDYSHRFDNTGRTARFNEFEYLSGSKLDFLTAGINRLSEYRWKDKYKAFNVYGTYQRTVASDHNFKLLLGYNQEEFDRDRVLARMDGLLIRDLANLSLGTEMYSIEGSTLDWAVQGYFGRFNYDYKNKYLLEVNARYDGSSRFPTESRWGLFPSVSVGWQMDRENFWEPIRPYVTSLKLRGSYGRLGNQTVDVNTFKELMNVGQMDWLDGGKRFVYADAPNPLPKVVTWETTQSLDIGADIGVLHNRLFVNFDWYRKVTDGMYLPGAPLPSVFGAAEPKENYAALRNNGFELGVSYRNKFDVAGSPLNFSVSANVSNFRGYITRYDNPEGLMSTYWEGQRLGEIWGYKVDGQFQSDAEAKAYMESFTNPASSLGEVYNYEMNIAQNTEWIGLKAGDIKYLDTDDDGRIDKGSYTLEDHGDLMPIGNAMPQFPFGLNMSANWKNFDLSVAVAGVGQQHWYPTGDLYWGPYARPYLSFIRKDLIDNAWRPDKPQNTYPQIYRGYVALGSERSLYEMNDYYLENVAFMRVKNLTVGYTIPQKWTQRAKIDRLRVFFSGENMFTWAFGGLTKYIDPEQAGSAVSFSRPGDAVKRADLRDYPMGKTFSFGVNLSL